MLISDAHNGIQKSSRIVICGGPSYPKAHWKRICTTNAIERINKELERRSIPVGAFPRDKSLMRIDRGTANLWQLLHFARRGRSMIREALQGVSKHEQY
jgi:transposase-like protein